MKSTDDRMSEVLRRARTQETLARRRRQRVVAVGGTALSVLVIVAIGISATSLGPSGGLEVGGPLGLMGSVFAEGAALGYITVGLLGLALGVAMTALSFHLGRKPDCPDLPVAQASDDSTGHVPVRPSSDDEGVKS